MPQPHQTHIKIYVLIWGEVMMVSVMVELVDGRMYRLFNSADCRNRW